MITSPKLILPLLVTAIACFDIDTASGQADPFNQWLNPTRQGLRRISNRDIGRGYSVNDVIRQDLQSVSPRVFPGQPRVTASSIAGGPGVGPSSTRKPFSGVTPSPTVSPYLLLTDSPFETDSTLSDTYNTLVRPMLRQQQFNRQVSRETQTIERELQNIAAQPAFNPRGSQSLMPTGHSAVFMNTGRYYPGNFRRR